MVEKNVGINAEWDKLTKVMIHTPGRETFYGLLSPLEGLMEKPFNLKQARAEHLAMQDALKGEGVYVYEAREEFLRNPRSIHIAKELLAQTYEKVYQREGYDAAGWKKDLDVLVDGLPSEYLFDAVVLNLSAGDEYVTLDGARSVREEAPVVRSQPPLNNLFFMRDQQIVTDKGLIMSNMSKPARSGGSNKQDTRAYRSIGEPIITELAFESVGMAPVYKVSGDETLEGGDFIPYGKIGFIGFGSRTTKGAIMDIMDNGGFGFDQVIAVETPRPKMHPEKYPELFKLDVDDMDIMHLDTYWNPVGKDAFIAFTEAAKAAKLHFYDKTSTGYGLNKELTALEKNLYDFSKKDLGLNPIDTTKHEQLSYAVNLLTIDANKVLAVDIYKNNPSLKNNGKKNYFERFEDLNVDVVMDPRTKAHGLDMRHITKGYGCAHCMTAVFGRG